MRVGVVGCGLMGSGIAEVCARAGLDVVVVEADRQRVDSGRERLTASLRRAEARGKVADAAAVLDRIRLGHDPAALADREIVVEAIAENEQLKVEMFALIDKIVEALGFGAGYERTADATCSATTLRRRHAERAAAGIFADLHTAVLDAHEAMIGLDLDDVAVDGCITMSRVMILGRGRCLAL